MKRFKVYTKEKGLVETDYYDDVSNLTWHREDGSALIEYDNDRNLLCEEYMFNGKYHRLNGPAYIEYDNNGNIVYESYYMYGNRYKKNEYFKELLKRKLNSL